MPRTAAAPAPPRRTVASPTVADLLHDANAALDASGKSPRTIAEYKREWKHLAAAFPTHPVATITTRMIRDARDRMVARAATVRQTDADAPPPGPAGINRRVAAWGCFFQWASEAGPDGADEAYCPTNPVSIKALSYSAPPQAVRTWVDTERLVQAAGRDSAIAGAGGLRTAALIALMGFMGLRVAEAVAVRRFDMDLVDGPDAVASDSTLKVYGKGRKYRTLPFDARALRLVRAWMKAIFPDGEFPLNSPLFCGIGEHLSTDRAANLVAGAAAKAKLGNVTCHSLRRTYATEMHRLGTTIYDLMRLLGHAKPETTAKYICATADDVRQVVRDAEKEMKRRAGNSKIARAESTPQTTLDHADDDAENGADKQAHGDSDEAKGGGG